MPGMAVRCASVLLLVGLALGQETPAVVGQAGGAATGVASSVAGALPKVPEAPLPAVAIPVNGPRAAASDDPVQDYHTAQDPADRGVRCVRRSAAYQRHFGARNAGQRRLGDPGQGASDAVEDPSGCAPNMAPNLADHRRWCHRLLAEGQAGKEEDRSTTDGSARHVSQYNLLNLTH